MNHEGASGWTGLDANEEQLRADVKRAQDRYEQGKKDFDVAMSAARGIGLQNPDGAEAARRASVALHRSLRQYTTSLERYTAFMLTKRNARDST